jgi:nicotinamide mononucleotide adenylyltransferase
VRDILEADCIGGYLSPVHNSYNKSSLLKGEHRLTMTKLALEDSNWLNVDDWEYKRKNYSTTLPILKHIERMVKKNQLYPENINVSLICGADLLQSFNVPNLWSKQDMEDILKRDIFVLEREGLDLEDLIFTSMIFILSKR